MKTLFSSYKDERLSQLENKVYAETSYIILILAALDVLVRAFILDRPFTEWTTSCIICIVGALYAGLRMDHMGIGETEEYLDERQIKNKKDSDAVGWVGGILCAAIWNDGFDLPNEIGEWLKVAFVLGIASSLCYFVTYSILDKLRRT